MMWITWMTRKAVQQNSTRQPDGVNKEGGLRMDMRGSCKTTGDARQRWHGKRQRDNQPANRGKWEERHE